jgi:rSAM/selenodomain-associated transferase 1
VLFIGRRARVILAGAVSAPITTATLYVMAKEPVPGAVKTRLTPRFSQQQACACHEAFLDDTLGLLELARGQALSTCRLRSFDTFLAGTSAAGTANSKVLASMPSLSLCASRFGLGMVGQSPGDLGARMADLVRRGLERSEAVILIGADCPHMPGARIAEALTALNRADCVLGPSDDGGFYLVALRRRIPTLFAPGIDWGTDGVLAAVSERAAQAGCQVEFLSAGYDLDRPEDLIRLHAELQGQAGEPGELRLQGPPRTRAILDRFFETEPPRSAADTKSASAAMVVLTTVADAEAARALARALVEEKLAACVTQMPVVSTYRWQGKVHDDGEVLLLIKTRATLWNALRLRVGELHPYDVPELVALDADAVDAGYLRWLLDATS